MGFPYSESGLPWHSYKGHDQHIKHNIAIEPYLKSKDGGNNTMVVD